MKKISTISQLTAAGIGTHNISNALATLIYAMSDVERLALGIEGIHADLNGRGIRRLHAFERAVTAPKGRHCFRFSNDEAASSLRLYAEYRDTFWNNVHVVEARLDETRDIAYSVEMEAPITEAEALAIIAERAQSRAEKHARWAAEDAENRARAQEKKLANKRAKNLRRRKERTERKYRREAALAVWC